LDEKKKKNSGLRSVARYSGMAIEMFGLLLFMVFIGKKIDEYFQFEKSYATAVFVITGMFAYLYRMYLQLTKTKDK